MQAELPQNPSFCNENSQNKNRSNILGMFLALCTFQAAFKYILSFDLHEDPLEEKELLYPYFRQVFCE